MLHVSCCTFVLLLNSVCSQFLEGLFAFLRFFAILFEALLIEFQEEIHHFAGWEGGGLRGAKMVNKHFVKKLAFPKIEVFKRA